jgi:hypothetical protein
MAKVMRLLFHQREERTQALHQGVLQPSKFLEGDDLVRLEPCAAIRTRMEVEGFLANQIRHAAGNAEVPSYFQDGASCNSTYDFQQQRRVITRADDPFSASGFTPCGQQLWESSKKKGLVECTWQPEVSDVYGWAVLTPDFVRPPVEASLVATHWLAQVSRRVRAIQLLGIGLGTLMNPLVVSKSNRVRFVANLPLPYADADYVKEGCHKWHGIIVNIPDRNQLLLGSMLHGLDEHSNAGVVVRTTRKATDYSPQVGAGRYLEALRKHGESGTPVVVMGGLENYGNFTRAAIQEGLLTPQTIEGVDTTQHPLWFDYASGQTPATIQGTPPLTGRLMALWRRA